MKAFKCEKCGKFIEGIAIRWLGYWNYKTKSWNKIDLCKDCQDEIKNFLWRACGNKDKGGDKKI